MSSSGPGDEQEPPQWQQPQWQQPQQDQPSWQQPQDQPQWGGQQQQWQQAPQTPGSATAALILGICSLVICPLICGPLAIVYGNKAKSEIAGSGGRLTGSGLATAGLVLGWIGIGITVIFILIFIAALAGGSS